MSQPLGHDSRYRPAAAKFGAALSKRMHERKIGSKSLAPQAKVAVSAIGMYRGALNVPSLPVAQRLADALSAPELLEIAKEARTKDCRRCGRTFVASHHVARYCSIACRTLGAPGTQRSTSKPEEAVQLLRNELLRIGPVRKQKIGHALTLLEDVLAPVRQADGLTAVYTAAVAAMCAGCEPEGLCRTPECPLRTVSPLPIAGEAVDEAHQPLGRWGQPGAVERFGAQMRERWAGDEDRRQRASETMRARFATPEQRADHGMRVSVARRKGIAARKVAAG
jgi:hypothetical protein